MKLIKNLIVKYRSSLYLGANRQKCDCDSELITSIVRQLLFSTIEK